MGPLVWDVPTDWLIILNILNPITYLLYTVISLPLETDLYSLYTELFWWNSSHQARPDTVITSPESEVAIIMQMQSAATQCVYFVDITNTVNYSWSWVKNISDVTIRCFVHLLDHRLIINLPRKLAGFYINETTMCDIAYIFLTKNLL